MNILFVSPEYPGITPSGGLGSYLRNMSEALAIRGHSVTVITPSGNNGEICELKNGVQVLAPLMEPYSGRPFFAGRRFLWRFRFDFPEIRRMFHESRMVCRCVREFIRHTPVDVIHFSDYRGFAFDWALHFSSVPYVVRLSSPTRYIRELNEDTKSRELKWLHQIEMLPLRRCNSIYSPTQSMLDYVSGWVRRSGQVGTIIRSPVDTERFRPVTESQHDNVSKILVTGRVERRKGAMVVADALPVLFARNADVTVTWIGGDTPTAPGGASMVEWLRSRIPSQHQARFVWHAAVSFEQMPDVYREHPICWIPSTRDNLPNTGLEALASGCAVIASDQSGLDEIITHGETGMLFPRGDADALVHATLGLLDNPKLVLALGAAARNWACRNIGPSITALKLEDLLMALDVAESGEINCLGDS